ncbi:hypothetical protein D3C81_1358980 [compost metagenome]
MCDVFLPDAAAGIHHAYQHALPAVCFLPVTGADGQLATVLHRMDSIGKQIDQDLLQFAPIDRHRQRCLFFMHDNDTALIQ